MSVINLILALSNLCVLPVVLRAYSLGYNQVSMSFALAGACSFLFHLGERKHQLPGIYPFNHPLITWKLLWCDRIGSICAVISLIRVVPLDKVTDIPISLWISGGISLGILAISEQIPNQKFFLPHLIWHILAYILPYQLIGIIGKLPSTIK